MAAMTDMAELAARIKAITAAAAPRANRHLFGDRFAAIQTRKRQVQHLAVTGQETVATGFPPIELLGLGPFLHKTIERLFGRRLEKGVQHPPGVGEAFCRIHG